nr:MAG TPA: Putative transferase, nesg, ydcK, Structural Genomics.38A [Caudoviricetes sp.]
MKKFELTSETKINIFGKKLFRIKALISFADVEAGETGGWVEKEGNVNQSGNAWVYGDAEVSDNAKVYGNAEVYGNAKVYGNAEVYGNAKVYGNTKVYGNVKVYGNAEVSGDADYTTIHGFGTQFRTTTFFRCKDKKVRVACGCFFGTIPEFREQVKNTRKGKIAEEYLMIADLMEKHFEK